MSFTSRTNLGNFLNSNWYLYAVQRTGVSMPNCFTYATGRISEIVGYNQSLDGNNRVPFAAMLWNQHDSKFKQMSYAKKGALMIWANYMWIDGVWANAGHVAVCEDVIDANTVAWSQSNYGGSMFDYVKGNPNGYCGMTFLGYLWHNDLPDDYIVPKPSTRNVNGYEVILEEGAAKFLVDGVNVRVGGPKGKVVAQYNTGNTVKYWGKWIGNGHRYIVYTGASGNINFVAISGSEKYGEQKWASCY